jgi:transposase InsO family protein
MSNEIVSKLNLRLYKSNFSVKTPTGVSQGDTFVWFSLVDLLGINKLVKFFVFDFHEEFNVLIGHELLASLEANLDLGRKTMKIPSKEIEILFNDSQELNLVREDNSARNLVESPIKTGIETLDQMLDRFVDIFDDKTKLPPSLLIKHKIRTTDEEPVFTRNYKYPQVYKEKVEVEINKMLEKGIIRPSKSPYNSPIWVVGKKPDASGEEKIRIVIDYRKLNKKTIEDKFPIPNIDDLIYQLGRSKYYTTLDLTSGFHQLEMDPESIEKTAFSSDNNHYEFLRMPFGLRNAPPTFQRAMNSLFAGRPNVLVYLDDIIIFSETFDDHMKHLESVFEILRSNRLTVQPDKSKFCRTELIFLGYLINEEGIRPDPTKVQAIANLEIPRTEKQIKSFLGLTGFYRKLIKDYSGIAKPLTNCLKKSSKIDIHDKHYKASFETLRSYLTKEPILTYPNFEKPFFLTTDASNNAIGAVLAQENEKGVRHAIAYASRTLNPAEQNLSTIERELLSVVWATKYFRHYIYGTKFTLETDHKPLLWLSNLKEPNAKLMRWKLQLNEFNFDIKHVPGKANKVADALSRPFTLNVIRQKTPPLPILPPDEVSQVLEADKIPTPQPNVEEDNNEDFDLNKLVEERLEDLDVENSPSPMSDDPPDLRRMPESHNINVENQQIILKNNRAPIHQETKFENKTRISVGVMDQPSLRAAIEVIIPRLKPHSVYGLYMKPSHLSDSTREELMTEFTLELHQRVQGLKFKLYKNLTVDIEDKDEQALTIVNTHAGKTAHRGVNDNYEYLKKRYYWPNMKRDINAYINQCEICNVIKYDRNPIKAKYKETPTPDQPFVEIQADVFTWDKTPILTLIDKFSKRLSSYKLRAQNAREIVRKLKSYFRQNPKPSLIQSDNGTEFKSHEVRELLEIHNIQHLFSSEGHHDSLGLLNRCHSTLREVMRALKAENSDTSVKALIKDATIIINNTANTCTKLTPNEMTFGIEKTSTYSESELQNVKQLAQLDRYVDQLKLLHSKVKQKIDEEKNARTAIRNENREDPDLIPITNPAFIKTTHHRKEKNPYTEVIAKSPYHVESRGLKRKIHPNRLKRPKRNFTVPDGSSEPREETADLPVAEDDNTGMPGTSNSQRF